MVSRFAEEADAQWAERQAAVRMAGGEESYLQALRLQKYFDGIAERKRRQVGLREEHHDSANDSQHYATPVRVEGLEPRRVHETITEYKKRVKQELQRRRDTFS